MARSTIKRRKTKMSVIGAYKTKAEAEKHAKTPRRVGFKVRITRDPILHKWWKVWVGSK